jgi:hypothetical protein
MYILHSKFESFCMCARAQTENVLSVSDYSFPYIVIILSVVSNAVHFAFKLDQVSNSKREKPVLKKYICSEKCNGLLKSTYICLRIYFHS